MHRRTFLAASVAASAITTAGSAQLASEVNEDAIGPLRFNPPRKGRLKQSVCRWCYSKSSLDDLCKHAARIGLSSVELLGEKEWHIPAQHNLTCAIANGPTTITDGLNNPTNHDRFAKETERLLPLIKANNIPQMIVFSGSRRGLSDADGIRHCAAGLKLLTPIAERHGVTLIMELLNSKVDHKDYQCDRTPWGVELVKAVDSPRFKLLYDIYHMQIMEGDVIRTITDHHQHIAHYHTGGVPGRREIDETQELNYPAICKAIADTNFTGYLAQEFIPAHDPMTSLEQAFNICNI